MFAEAGDALAQKMDAARQNQIARDIRAVLSLATDGANARRANKRDLTVICMSWLPLPLTQTGIASGGIAIEQQKPAWPQIGAALLSPRLC